MGSKSLNPEGDSVVVYPRFLSTGMWKFCNLDSPDLNFM